MNGNDLLMYSLMKQRQERLLSEAAAYHLAHAQVRAPQVRAAQVPAAQVRASQVRAAEVRAAQAQARQSTVELRSDMVGQAVPVDPSNVGVLGPGLTSPPRVLRSDLVEGGGTTARRVGRAGPRTVGLRRLAARVGTSLVAVGQRLERMDRR